MKKKNAEWKRKKNRFLESSHVLYYLQLFLWYIFFSNILVILSTSKFKQIMNLEELSNLRGLKIYFNMFTNFFMYLSVLLQKII